MTGGLNSNCWLLETSPFRPVARSRFRRRSLGFHSGQRFFRANAAFAASGSTAITLLSRILSSGRYWSNRCLRPDPRALPLRSGRASDRRVQAKSFGYSVHPSHFNQYCSFTPPRGSTSRTRLHNRLGGIQQGAGHGEMPAPLKGRIEYRELRESRPGT